GAGLVSTIDDYAAFGQMLLNNGRHGNERILSRLSVEAMTTDQLTAQQKAGSGFGPALFETHGWGFGGAVVARRDGIAAVAGQYGGAGGLGRTWANDPKEGVVGVLLPQQAMTSPTPPAVHRDFWTLAYAAIDD